MSRLEEFIRTNRKRINEFEPPDNLWERIETQLDKKGKKIPVIKLRLLISLAALIVIVLISGLVFYQGSQGQQLQADMSIINSELAQQQVHYISVIVDKQTELNKIRREHPELYKEFSLVLDTVEQNYQQLKMNLANSPNPEETLKAMVINLQVQMEVLNQQLSIINQLNQYKNEQYETHKL